MKKSQISVQNLLLVFLYLLFWPVTVPSSFGYLIYSRSPKELRVKLIPFYLSIGLIVLISSAFWLNVIDSYLGPGEIEETNQIIFEQEQEADQEKSELIAAELIRVVDGDTIVVEIAGEQQRVRMIGLDAPEVGENLECFGAESSQFLEQLLSSTEIYLEMDETQGQRDRYDRLLAYVFLNDMNVNLELINNGYASEYTYNLPYKYRDKFIQAQTQAREEQIGMWGDACKCIKQVIDSRCVSCGRLEIDEMQWNCEILVRTEQSEQLCTRLCN